MDSRIEQLYKMLSPEGRELADFIYETGEALEHLSDKEQRYAFECVVVGYSKLSPAERLIVARISRLWAQEYDNALRRELEE